VPNKNLRSRAYEYLNVRFELDSLVEFLGSKKVPRHGHSIFYYTGGAALFLFIVQVCSGILLLMYYKGSADSAFESVRYIMSEVPFGWLVRDVHSWSANLMVLFAFVHMFAVFFTKAYRFPRELTWFSGIFLLLLSLGFGFSGYLLPWNELSYFATKVGTDIMGAVPFVGEYMLKLLRGSEDVTATTLSRFFGIHVAVLPGIFVVFLTFHLIFVQRQGMSEPSDWSDLPESKKSYTPFFPQFLLKDLSLWVIILAAVAILAVFSPWELGQKADPFASAPTGIKPEWYFMFMFQTLKFIPAHVLFIEGEVLGILTFMVGGIIWALVPLYDRDPANRTRSRLLTYIGAFVLLYIIVFTIIGYVAG
jgi:cytochrome b6